MDTKAIVAALEKLIDELNAEDVRRMTEPALEPPPVEMAKAEEIDAALPEEEDEEKKGKPFPFAKKG